MFERMVSVRKGFIRAIITSVVLALTVASLIFTAAGGEYGKVYNVIQYIEPET